MGVVIGVLVEGVLIWAAIRYRHRGNDQLPPQIHGNTIVEIAWTTAQVIVVGYILFLTLPVIFQTQAPAPSSSMNVEVIGHQFWWEFQYPDAQVDTANELHLPVGRTVNLILHSNDVIHSFWIPALGGRQARRDPWTHQLHLAHTQLDRRVPWPVLPAVRLFACQHAQASHHPAPG